MHEAGNSLSGVPGIAVIMTCHNRRATTVSCLQGLAEQRQADVRVRLFVTDDGSTDGTAEAISALCPDATVIRGDGNLYWAAGMALAERAAVRERPDYLLWLNDDTLLRDTALAELLATSARHPGSIVVGATTDPDNGGLTYGGRRRVDSHPQRFEHLPFAAHAQTADTFNGNVVLIPWSARQRVGPIDGLFPHAYADDDYGLRATALGVPIIQAPNSVGTCRTNPLAPCLTGGPLARWRKLQQTKAMPWRAQARFLKRHGDWRWSVILVGGQARRVLGLGR